jgi:hypothetical protein
MYMKYALEEKIHGNRKLFFSMIFHRMSYNQIICENPITNTFIYCTFKKFFNAPTVQFK